MWALHFPQQVAPLLAFWGQRFMADLNSSFAGMAASTEDLQIAQRIGEFGMRPNGLDVIDLQAVARAALHATPAVTIQHPHPKRLPAGTTGDTL